jgi:hypothetical protein
MGPRLRGDDTEIAAEDSKIPGTTVRRYLALCSLRRV